MKKIYFIIIVLLGVMITLAYLYFSKLNRDTNNNEMSLYAVTAKSGLIFCFQNDKSVLDLLSSQDLLQSLLSEEKLQALQSLQKQLLNIPEINKLINKENIYISFIPGENKDIDFLLSTQTSIKQDPLLLSKLLKSKKISVEKLEDFWKLTLKDTTTFYLAQKNNLILLSMSFKGVSEGLKASEHKNNPDFIEYIKSNHKITRNSLATLYVNFNYLENLLKLVSPVNLKQDFPILNKQNAYANFSYSFSRERILFNGSTIVNNRNSYLNLFSDLNPEKITIDAVLPENTANYTIYAVDNYKNWSISLNTWFTTKKKTDEIKSTINKINTTYHLDLNGTFPKYFKNQLATFQLKSKETFGVINLSNGDKLNQLLLDLSSEYSTDIKVLIEPNLLYCYFGEPFEKFKKPYYTIIDNYMVFSNYPSSIQVFLNSYKNNKQLITNKSYSAAYDQLSAQSNILFYVNQENSENIARNNLFLPYYKLYKSKKNLGRFDSFIYQLSSDHKKFQSNLLVNKTADFKIDTIPSF